MPSCTTATGVSAGRPPASSASANASIRSTPIISTIVPRSRASASQSVRLCGWPGATCPDTTTISWATPRWLTGTSATAGTAKALVTPGTTVTGTPASAQARTSSKPRPKTYGSPPLSRTTNRPARACSTSSSLIRSWFIARPYGIFDASMTSTCGRELVEQVAGAEPVGDDDVRAGQQPPPAHGDQLRVAGAAADQRDAGPDGFGVHPVHRHDPRLQRLDQRRAHGGGAPRAAAGEHADGQPVVLARPPG